MSFYYFGIKLKKLILFLSKIFNNNNKLLLKIKLYNLYNKYIKLKKFHF